jgi:hypothetical protein
MNARLLHIHSLLTDAMAKGLPIDGSTRARTDGLLRTIPINLVGIYTLAKLAISVNCIQRYGTIWTRNK